MNVLITGKPGVGKTTLIQKIVSKLDLFCQGFYTREIKQNQGQRSGFEIVTLDGQIAVLAHTEYLSRYRVGKYFVNIDNINHVIVPCIESAIEQAQLIIIDEIGKMELLSPQFQRSITRALDCTKPVLGTITISGIPIIKQIKSRQDVYLVTLKRDNHREVYQLIIDLLTEK